MNLFSERRENKSHLEVLENCCHFRSLSSVYANYVIRTVSYIHHSHTKLVAKQNLILLPNFKQKPVAAPICLEES